MVVLVTCKNEEDPITNEGAYQEWPIDFSIINYWSFLLSWKPEL